MFALSHTRDYVCITGSANMKWDAFASKANNQPVLHERALEHPIYGVFKVFYERAQKA